MSRMFHQCYARRVNALAKSFSGSERGWGVPVLAAVVGLVAGPLIASAAGPGQGAGRTVGRVVLGVIRDGRGRCVGRWVECRSVPNSGEIHDHGIVTWGNVSQDLVLT